MSLSFIVPYLGVFPYAEGNFSLLPSPAKNDGPHTGLTKRIQNVRSTSLIPPSATPIAPAPEPLLINHCQEVVDFALDEVKETKPSARASQRQWMEREVWNKGSVTPLLPEDIMAYNRRMTADLAFIEKKMMNSFESAQLCKDEHDHAEWFSADLSRCRRSFAFEGCLGGRAGAAWMQGRRESMEDEHLISAVKFQKPHGIEQGELFCVFDGHSGKSCASYFKKNIKNFLENSLSQVFLTPNELPETVVLYNTLTCLSVYMGAAYRLQYPDTIAGCAAIMALIFADHIWVANTGDCRAILVPQDQELAPIALSEDAKLFKPKYKRGALKRRGKIQYAYQKNAQLECPRYFLRMARAAGHAEVNTGVNPRAEVIRYPLASLPAGKHFLLVACDGFWDVASMQQTAKSVRKRAYLRPDQIATCLMKKAYQAGSRDNITLIVFEIDI